MPYIQAVARMPNWHNGTEATALARSSEGHDTNVLLFKLPDIAYNVAERGRRTAGENSQAKFEPK